MRLGFTNLWAISGPFQTLPFETHQLTRSIYFNVATILAIIFIRLPYDMLQHPFPHLRYNNILATTFWTLATRLHRQLM